MLTMLTCFIRRKSIQHNKQNDLEISKSLFTCLETSKQKSLILFKKVIQFTETLAEEVPLSSSLSSIFSMSTISSASLSSSSAFSPSSSWEVVSFLKGWKADSLNPGLDQRNNNNKVFPPHFDLPEKWSVHELRYSSLPLGFSFLSAGQSKVVV